LADLGRAVRFIERAQYREAELVLQAVVTELPQHGPAWHQLALCRRLLGRDEAALAAIKTSLAVDGKNPEALLLAAELLLATQPDEAAAHATRACAEAGGNPRIKALSIRILWVLGRYDEALTLVTKALAASPKDHDLLMMKADLALTLRQYEEAAAAYGTLVELRPFDPIPPQNLAAALVHLGRKPEAAKALARSLEIRPSNTTARQKLIALMEELGYPKDAIATEKTYLKHYTGMRVPEPPRATPGSEPPTTPERESDGSARRPATRRGAARPSPGGR
jgi:Flp pilus assembly protein TadD